MNLERENNQEIDVVFLFKKLKELLLSICFSFVVFVKFLFRNKYIILSLLIAGIILGYLLDNHQKSKYKTELVVIPNFETVDLLYSEIDNFKSNLNKKKIEFDYLNDVSSVEIKPVENLGTVLQDKENLEIFKVLSETQDDLSKIVKDEQFEKSYKYHLITITTNSANNSQKIVDYILKTINEKSYYKNRSKIAIKNQQEAKIQAEKSIEQINKILEKMGSGELAAGGKDLNINNYDQLNNVIELKSYYIKELMKINTKLIEYDKAIYPVDISYNNNLGAKKFYSQFIILIPISLLFVYFILVYLKYFFQKYNRLYLKRHDL